MINFKLYERQHEHLVVMIHGFLGSIETFQAAASKLIEHVDVLLVECPGHGASFDISQSWSFDAIANALKKLVTLYKSKYTSITLYGYSMGGRLALYTTIQYPDLVDKLILESSTPGIQDETQRQLRIDQDKSRSEQIESNFEMFIQQWESMPLFHTFKPLDEAAICRQRQIRMNHHPKGIAKALTDYGTGMQPNLWPQLKGLTLPVLLLTGSLDKKFEMIAQQMIHDLPDATHHIINAGHTIHVENLKIFDTIIVSFIKEENHD